MAVIYRRNPHGSGRLTTTIPLHHNADGMRHGGSLDIQDHAEDDDDDIEAANGRIARLLQRCRRWRRRRRKRTSTGMSLSTTAPTSLSTRSALAHRICQILWLALLVYSFFGLPVLGRILNIARYFHRFTVLSVLTGLFVGFLQDFAIFLQASTLFVLIKMLFQPLSLQRRLSSTSAATTSTSASSSSGLLGGSTAMAALAQERYPRQVHLPVYFPVRTNDFELHGASASGSSHPALPSVSSTASTASTASSLSETDILNLAPTSAASVGTGTGGVGNNSSLPFNATHLTLVASSNSAATTFPLRYPLSGFMREGAMMGLKQLPGN